MDKLVDIERRLRAIELRNQRVEADKAWEVSLTRRMLVAGLTYVVIATYLMVIRTEQPWKNAVVPAVSFLLSMAVVSVGKSLWLRRHNR